MFLVNVLGAIFLLPALAAWFNLSKPLVADRSPVTAAEDCIRPRSGRKSLDATVQTD